MQPLRPASIENTSYLFIRFHNITIYNKHIMKSYSSDIHMIQAGEGKSSGRLVAARVAALEAAHQAEVNELKRALTDAVNLQRESQREQEKLERKSRNSSRELEEFLRNLEERCHTLRDTARRLEELLPGLETTMQSHERRAHHLKDI